MPSDPVWIDEGAAASTKSPIDVGQRGSPDLVTTTTADPGASGTTLAVTSAARFPSVDGFKVRVEGEVMLVTAGAGTTSWTVTRAVDNTSAVAHAAGVTVALVVGVQRVSPVSERSVSAQVLVAAFRTLGNAATPQNLFSIENAAASKVLVAIRRLTVDMDATAVLTAVAPQFKTSRPTALPTGGTTLVKVPLDTALASSASVVCRGATASDGGAATAITATAGTFAWSQSLMRLHTAVGQVLPDEFSLLPREIDTDPMVLRAGEALLVQVVAAAAASNAATNHYNVRAFLEEFTLP